MVILFGERVFSLLHNIYDNSHLKQYFPDLNLYIAEIRVKFLFGRNLITQRIQQ